MRPFTLTPTVSMVHTASELILQQEMRKILGLPKGSLVIPIAEVEKER